MLMDYVMTAISQQPLLAMLAQRGWVRRVTENANGDTLLDEMRRIGDVLGARAGGRGGALEEVLRPHYSEDAHPRSLSAQYGLNALPFHAEQCHRTRPCRYLLLGCIAPGSPSSATMLIDWRTLDFSSEELNFLAGAPIFVRTGRRSFYSTILPADRAFLRYDPGCIEAADERGRRALRLVEHRLAHCSPDTQQWWRGDILIIDNWRILHARGPSDHNSARQLARILIDA
jgi:hypothetical protein